MTLIQCPECGRDVSDKAEKCIHCGYPLCKTVYAPEKPEEGIDAENLTHVENSDDKQEESTEPFADKMDANIAAPAQPKNNILRIIIGLVIVAVIFYNLYFYAVSFSPSYYVAKFPHHSAASVKVDGYMHKSKSCCQKVADAFGAEVIRIKPNKKAGTNNLGQEVQYSDCFYYCPLCCN